MGKILASVNIRLNNCTLGRGWGRIVAFCLQPFIAQAYEIQERLSDTRLTILINAWRQRALIIAGKKNVKASKWFGK